MSNIFDIEYIFDDSNNEEHKPILSNKEYIEKTKKLLQKLLDGYSNSWESPIIEEDGYTEYPPCTRCGGMLYIEQGGETVDCTSCNGEGIELEACFNSDDFIEFVEHDIIFNKDFFDLLEGEIDDK